MNIVRVGNIKIILDEIAQWNNLFKRYDGWTGADGIYAIPLSGYETQGKADETKTLFVFSDTFIGQVDQKTMRRQDISMVNNSLAILEGGEPDENKIQFIYGNNGDGSRSSVFIPKTPKTRGKKCWYWLQDGISLNNNIYIFPMVVEEDPKGADGFKFRLSGLAMIKIPINNGNIDLVNHTQSDTPFYSVNEKRTLFFGAGIMPNTAESGAVEPDGYIYVYGRYECGEVKLAVARVKPDDFEDFNKWRFWNGESWSDNIEETAELGRGGPELSVTPIKNGPLKGKYLMVSMHVEQDLYIRIGESPTGPFGQRINIYHTTEPNAGNGIYTYNAKAHPSLSKLGEWLISYNVNSTSWYHLINNSDIYRPRFLKMRIQEV